MNSLRISSYIPSPPVLLTPEQRDGISRTLPSVQMVPASGSSDHYVLTAGSVVGAITVANLELMITPRIPIERVMYLLSWSLGSARWQADPAPANTDSLVEAIVPVFLRLCEKATRRGLLHGYRRDEDALVTIRGRVRVDEQLRRHYGRMPPVEVEFDEYTDDILENRFLLAATSVLAKRRLKAEGSVQGLRRLASMLGSVSSVEFSPRRIPSVSYTQLNEHYRQAIELARLILRFCSPELGPRHRSDGLLFDINEVFEGYVHAALRDRLALSVHEFPKNCNEHSLHLDNAKRLRLEPDLSWWKGSRCRFVGDVKFKLTATGKGKHSDVYQLLAYETAAGLADGMLVYAAGEADPINHDVRLGGQRIRVRVLDIAGTIQELEEAVGHLADEIRVMGTTGDFAPARMLASVQI